MGVLQLMTLDSRCLHHSGLTERQNILMETGVGCSFTAVITPWEAVALIRNKDQHGYGHIWQLHNDYHTSYGTWMSQQKEKLQVGK